MKIALIAVFCSISTAFITYFAMRSNETLFVNSSALDHPSDEQDQIDGDDDGDVGEILLDTDSIALDECDAAEEIEAIRERRKCNFMVDKSGSFWGSFAEAEKFVFDSLQSGNLSKLDNYISCNALDLSWYEIHCEADRIRVDPKLFSKILTHILGANNEVLAAAKWVRVKPDKRRLRNASWVLRSRLVSEKMILGEPWKGENHPTEQGTILLLEQSLDGKIYIAGIPVTGVN